MTVASFAAAIVARHRVRRRFGPRLGLVFARRPLAAAAGSPARERHACASAASVRLELVLAPRISLTLATPRHEGPSTVRVAAASPQLHEARIAARQLERVVEHAATLAVRHERVAVDPAVAFGQMPPGTNASLAASPPQLVLARTSAAPPASADSPAAPTARQPAPSAAAWAPAPHEIERLTDRVLSSIDRRLVAERERRGAV
jgi:hypothetical protein